MKKFFLWIIIGVCIVGICLFYNYINNRSLYGFVDRNGKFIHPMQHRKIELCKGDSGVCVSVQNKSVYDNYDENGKLLFKSKYPCQEKFGDYYTYFKRPFKFGVVMDKTGKIISKHKGTVKMRKFLGCDVAFYSEDLNVAYYCVNITAKVNKTKDILENVVFPGEVNEYRKIYFKENGKYGLYDYDGNIIAKPVFSKPVEDVYKNMYIQGNVLVDEKENILFDPQNWFKSNDLDKEYHETKFNIIDKKLYITFYNQKKKEFVTYCENNGKFEDTGFYLKQINTQPKSFHCIFWIDNESYYSIEYDRGMRDKALCYKYNGKMLVTDLEGNTVINGDYDELRSYEAQSKTCIVKKNGKYGAVAKGNKVILPFIYDNLDFVTHNNTLFATGGKSDIEMDGYLIHGKNVCLIDGKGKTISVMDIFVNDKYAYADCVSGYVIFDMKGRKITDPKEYKYAERINRNTCCNADENIREEIIKKNKLNKKDAGIIRRSNIYYSPYGYVAEFSKNSRGEGIWLIL